LKNKPLIYLAPLLLIILAVAFGASRVSGQEADSTAEQTLTLAEAAGAPTAVPKGYFLFPIAPGQPGLLAGSMGELRPNHFHGGLDIKTAGGENRPVYASADGYVSRLKQSSFGYGNVLYITHPNGLTTVYGHLNAFRGPVAQELRRLQYEKQTYELELFPRKDQFLVKRGEVVALSGNTGGSAGPHLHWEVRDAQDRQLNPLQWGGFPEIQDHVAPTLQALAVEPLTIESRVRGQFEKALLVPRVLPGPGVATVWPDTISCFGTVGLLVQGFDRFDNAWNKNGIQRVQVKVNGQPHYEHAIDRVPFVGGTRQVANFVDFQYQFQTGRPLQKLWVDEGNDLVFYNAPGPGKGRLQVEAGEVYTVDISLSDSYGNETPVRVVLRGQEPAYFKTRLATVRKPALRYDITRNLLRVRAADPETAAVGANLQLFRSARRLELRPSYTVNSENVYLFDLRAGLPDSMRFGPVTKKFDRQVMIPAGKETAYATARLALVFEPQTLFDNLYLSTSYKPEPSGSGLWTVGSALTPLYRYLRLTLKPPVPPADLARSAIYAVSGQSRAYVGGNWDAQGHISAPIRKFGAFRILTDTTAPTGQYVGRPGGQLVFRVGDDMSGLASYQLLVGGRFRLLRFEHKKATLFTVAGDTLGPPLRGPAELRLRDQAGNERVLKLNL
jgi:hypothetical protein